MSHPPRTVGDALSNRGGGKTATPKMIRRRYTEQQFRDAVADPDTKTMADLCRALGIVPRGANYETVRRFAAKIELELPQRVGRRPNPFDDLEASLVREAIASSTSIAATLRFLDVSDRETPRRLLKAFIREHGVDVTHWTGQGWARGQRRPPRVPLDSMLVSGRRVSGTSIRRRLIAEGVRNHRCEDCLLTDWRGAPIPPAADHVNGDSWDNRLENLSNYQCACTVETFSRLPSTTSRRLLSRLKREAQPRDGITLTRYQSVDALQNALAASVFNKTNAPKKAAGRALGTLVELVTFYMVRDWGLESSLAIERGLPEYGNADIKHNVEFTLHPARANDAVRRHRPERSLTCREMLLSFAEQGIEFNRDGLRPLASLSGRTKLRHACVFAEDDGSFWVSYITGNADEFEIAELKDEPYAMLECKRVGVEEGQKKGPQTIEKAKQGAYVARSVSGLQRIPLKDGSVAALVEEADGTLSTHDDYYGFLQDAIDSGDLQALQNVILTVGVVSNHGNWFTAEEHNKEMRVLAQSYDWLLFLTDSGLAEFIVDVLQGEQEHFEATRRAFVASFGRLGGATQFTKVIIDKAADQELTDYFASEQPWSRWFNVITPDEPIQKLRDDLLQLKSVHDQAWEAT